MALDFDLSEEQQQIQLATRNLFKRFAPRRAELRKQIFVEHQLPAELWAAFTEAGFLGALIPESYGGSAMGLLPLALAIEEMGAVGFGSALLILTAMDTACIVKNGSEELKRAVLPRIAKGELKLCFGLTEPNAGSNTFRIESHAKKDGNGWRLDGQKVFITGADVADKMLVAARTTTTAQCQEQGLPKAYGVSLFLIDSKSKGLSMTPLPTRGIEGANQFSIFFEDVRLERESLVGDENGGMLALFNSLNPERILAAALATGMADHVLERAVEYAKERKVFGDRAIGSYQAIAHPLAETAIETEACRMLYRRAAWAYDQGRDPAEVGFVANAAKLKAADNWIAATDRAIETLGGYGFSEDYGIIYYWEAARLLRTAPISREMILNFVAEHHLGLPRSY